MSFNGAPSYSPQHLGHPRWISVFLQLKTGFIFTPLSVIKNVQKMLFGKCSATRQLTPSLPESCSSLIWCLGAQSCNDASMPLQIASAKRTEQKAEPLNLHTIDPGHPSACFCCQQALPKCRLCKTPWPSSSWLRPLKVGFNSTCRSGSSASTIFSNLWELGRCR